MRTKHPDDPKKFMDSEVELDTAIQVGFSSFRTYSAVQFGRLYLFWGTASFRLALDVELSSFELRITP